MMAVIDVMAAGANGRRAVAHGEKTRFAPSGNASSPGNISYRFDNKADAHSQSNLSLSTDETKRPNCSCS